MCHGSMRDNIEAHLNCSYMMKLINIKRNGFKGIPPSAWLLWISGSIVWFHFRLKEVFLLSITVIIQKQRSGCCNANNFLPHWGYRVSDFQQPTVTVLTNHSVSHGHSYQLQLTLLNVNVIPRVVASGMPFFAQIKVLYYSLATV